MDEVAVFAIRTGGDVLIGRGKTIEEVRAIIERESQVKDTHGFSLHGAGLSGEVGKSHIDEALAYCTLPLNQNEVELLKLKNKGVGVWMGSDNGRFVQLFGRLTVNEMTNGRGELLRTYGIVNKRYQIVFKAKHVLEIQHTDRPYIHIS